MRLGRFGGDRVGLVRQDHVVDVTGICDRLPNFRYPLPKFDPFIAELDSLREPIREVAEDQPGIPIGEVKFGAPVANPGKIIGAPVITGGTSRRRVKTPKFTTAIRLPQLNVWVSSSRLLVL